jgi:hypothetical protein
MKQPLCFITFFVKDRDTTFWDLPAEYRNNFFQSRHRAVLKNKPCRAKLYDKGTQSRILICFTTPKNFSISPRDKELQPFGGPVYSMFLYFLRKSSQALKHGPGLYSGELAAEYVWLDRARDW